MSVLNLSKYATTYKTQDRKIFWVEKNFRYDYKFSLWVGKYFRTKAPTFVLTHSQHKDEKSFRLFKRLVSNLDKFIYVKVCIHAAAPNNTTFGNHISIVLHSMGNTTEDQPALICHQLF